MNENAQEFLPSRCETLRINGLRYNVRHWGREGAPRVFMLHGWMDSSATFQFLVDALKLDVHVIAPDWRGFGASEWLGRPYWFPDYYADLEALLAHYSPDEPACLVGHSMGAAVASIYAGARPARVRRVVMMDFLGLPASDPKDAPTRIAHWLAQIAAGTGMRGYADADALAARLREGNPRLTESRAAFLARNVSRAREDGSIEMACDGWHRLQSPLLYHIDDVMGCWRAVAAPVLMLEAEHGYVHQRFCTTREIYAERVACFRDCRVIEIADAGHNLQHDQPEAVAAAIRDFVSY